MFKTRLDTFGNDFGLFWNFEKFWFFEIISKTRPYMEHWAKKNFSKSTPKHVQSIFGQFGSNFGRFWNFESFLFFWKHSEDSTLHGTLGKKNFRKNYPITCSKHFWTLLGTTLGFFGILKNFDFLRSFRRLDPTWNTGKKNLSKSTPKHVQSTFGQFGSNFGRFWNFEKFWFFENVSKTRPSIEHWANKIFPKKYPKTCSKHFWTVWVRLWAFLEIWIFLYFSKNISKTRPSMEHWAK